MMRLADAYLVDAVRTPVGRFKGALASVRPDDLAALVIKGLLERQKGLAGRVDHVVFGATNQAGEDNRNVARMAGLLAGLPYEVPAVTVNRLCGSGLEAVTDAVMRIWTGDAEVVIAGGVESMTRAPFVMKKSDEAWGRTPPPTFDTTLGWRFENPKMAERFPLQSMGETAENVADKWKITRVEQDEFAVSSQTKAGAAAKSGAFDREILPVTIAGKKAVTVVDKDEGLRPDTTKEALAALSPVFRKNGTVTAGNSSPLNDGASGVLVVSEAVLKAEKLTPLARVVAFATAGVEPNYMGEGPIPATKRALARADWSMKELDLIELNEAFAAQAIACQRALEIDPAKLNVHGGAIAIGHPIGSSGCRILVTLAHALSRHDKKKGLAGLCIGVGQGIAMLIERG